jgi:hypothetical protein
MPGTSATGGPASSAMAVDTLPEDLPATPRMAGFKARMKTMGMKVVMPATILV